MKHLNFILIFFNFLIIFLSKIDTVYSIVGGTDAEVGQFKYQVSVQDRNGHKCGGAIVSERHVITAAHCIIDSSDNFINEKFFILAGVTALDSNDPNRVIVQVHKAFVPTEFQRMNPNPTNHNFLEIRDLAVLKLQNSLRLDRNPALSILKLPELSKSKNYFSYHHERVIITGFGLDTPPSIGDKRGRRGEGVSDNRCNKLKFAEAAVLQKSMCNNMWSPFKITNHHVCARINQLEESKPSGACEGDDGAPMVLNGDTLIGVLATTRPDCSEVNNAGIYTRITALKSFINKAFLDKHKAGVRIAIYDQGESVQEIYRYR